MPAPERLFKNTWAIRWAASDAITSVAFDSDGKRILTAGHDHIAWLWDTQTGKVIRRFMGQSKTINRAVFTPDDKTVITACADGTVWLWDTETGSVIRQLGGHTSDILTAAISQDGTTLANGQCRQDDPPVDA